MKPKDQRKDNTEKRQEKLKRSTKDGKIDDNSILVYDDIDSNDAVTVAVGKKRNFCNDSDTDGWQSCKIQKNEIFFLFR